MKGRHHFCPSWCREKSTKKNMKVRDDAISHCDLIDDMDLWRHLKTVIDDLEPICLGTNMNQSDAMCPDQALLTFAGMFLHFSKHSKPAVAARMSKRIEKRWKALDQPMFILALVLNPFDLEMPLLEKEWKEQVAAQTKPLAQQSKNIANSAIKEIMALYTARNAFAVDLGGLDQKLIVGDYGDDMWIDDSRNLFQLDSIWKRYGIQLEKVWKRYGIHVDVVTPIGTTDMVLLDKAGASHRGGWESPCHTCEGCCRRGSGRPSGSHDSHHRVCRRNGRRACSQSQGRAVEIPSGCNCSSGSGGID